jgi:hypothetical protein
LAATLAAPKAKAATDDDKKFLAMAAQSDQNEIPLSQVAEQKATDLRHNPISFIRKDNELPHRVDGKTSLLLPLVERPILEKSLDVAPAKRLLGKKSPLPLAFKIVPKAHDKKIFLVSEL